MEAKIAFLTQVLWGSSVCYCVQSILYAGRYNPTTKPRTSYSLSKYFTMLCTIISGAIL